MIATSLLWVALQGTGLTAPYAPQPDRQALHSEVKVMMCPFLGIARLHAKATPCLQDLIGLDVYLEQTQEHLGQVVDHYSGTGKLAVLHVSSACSVTVQASPQAVLLRCVCMRCCLCMKVTTMC